MLNIYLEVIQSGNHARTKTTIVKMERLFEIWITKIQTNKTKQANSNGKFKNVASLYEMKMNIVISGNVIYNQIGSCSKRWIASRPNCFV